MIVQIASKHLDVIRHAARIAEPEECCGLVTGVWQGEGLRIDDLHPSMNTSGGDKTRTFEVDPKLRFDLMRAHQAGIAKDIVGHYHSHPLGPAAPSATDLKMTHEPDFVWLICGSDGDIKAFKPRTDRTAFDALTMHIVD